MYITILEVYLFRTIRQSRSSEYMPVLGDKKMLFCRPLSAVTDHRRCTQLQREGGQAQISRFLSAESASTLRPTASRRDDRRASTRRSFQKACVVPTPPIAGRGECIDTSLVATAFGGSRSEDGANRRSVSQPGQASERRVAQTEWGQSFRPDFSLAGERKPGRSGAGSAQISPRPYGSRPGGGWRGSPQASRVQVCAELELCRADLRFNSGIPLSSLMMQTDPSDKRVG